MDHKRRAWASAFIGVALCSTAAAHAAAVNSGPAGGGAPVNNMQPVQAVSYIIAMFGAYPTRDGSGADGIMLGEVRRFAGNFAPGGWAFADGQLLTIANNEALFSLLGTTYGGNGSTTFALPDLRGRTPVHVGQGPGLTERFLGERSGAENVVLSPSMNAVHTHPQPSGGASGPSGGNQPIANMMPYLGLNFIISVGAGGYPNRDGGIQPTFLAEVRMFAGNFAPGGWAFTNGQLLAINTNQALFSLVGTTYGGDGRTTFALPDLRGRTPIGEGSGSGLAARFLGESLGVEAFSLTQAQLPAHVHAIPGGGNTGSAGGGQPHTNMQPSMALTAIVARAGSYPSPSGSSGDAFIAETRLFAGNFAPGGFALANGTVLQIAEDPTLFSLVGTLYGGDGSSTFALPDLRGRAPIHRGQGPGLAFRDLGVKVGTEAESLVASQMGIHTHLVQLASSVPAMSEMSFALLFVALMVTVRLQLRRR